MSSLTQDIDSPDLIVERDNGVVTLTLNRPRRKNAITAAGWRDLIEAFRSVDPNTDRLMIVTGADGDFCSGADLSVEGQDDVLTIDLMKSVGEACLALHDLPVPTIARVDGVAVGAGLNLALACDFVVATTRSRFSEIFVRRGLSVDFGGSWLLPRLVGMHVAKELVLLGEVLDAERALELGLVRRVVEPELLDRVVADLAVRLQSVAPVAQRLSKQMLNNSFQLTLREAVEVEGIAQHVNTGLMDAQEATQAFLEKRDPVFRGR